MFVKYHYWGHLFLLTLLLWCEWPWTERARHHPRYQAQFDKITLSNSINKALKKLHILHTFLTILIQIFLDLTKFGNTVSEKIEYGLNAKLRIVPVILSRGDNFICHFHGNLLGTICYFAENSYSFKKIYYFHPLNL